MAGFSYVQIKEPQLAFWLGYINKSYKTQI